MNSKFKLVQEACALHPLDEQTESGFGDIKVPKDNYYRRVHSHLTGIIQETTGVHEKDCQGVTTIMENADKLLRTLEAQRIVERFESGKERPQYCAECIYSRIKK